MKRIDFETAVLLDEVMPDFGCNMLWVDDNSKYKRVADWRTWVVELEPQGFKKYPMPYTEQIVEALRDEHLVFLWVEPFFSNIKDITPTWRVYARHKGHEVKIVVDTDPDTALEKAVVSTLQNIKKQKNEEKSH